MVEPDQLSEVGIGLRLGVKEIVHSSSPISGIIDSALEEDINLLEIVNTIGQGRVEQRVGKQLRKKECREEMFLITKGGVEWNSDGEIVPDGSPAAIREGVEASLELLGFETLDCYQIYWPDSEVPFDETLDALSELKREGLIRFTGLTNFSVEQIKTAVNGGSVDFVQFPYSLFQRQAENSFLPYCKENGIRTLTYGVLCRGLLTDEFLERGKLKFDTLKSRLPEAKENLSNYRRTVRQISEFLEAENVDAPLASVLIAWTLARKGITHSLAVAHNREQVEVVDRARNVEMTDELLDGINSIARENIEDIEKEFVRPPHQD